jgi:uncharacterized protein YcbX
MAEMKLTALYRYPVKSLRAESASRLAVGARGFVGDREWMIVDADGRFLTQRQQPRMCLVDCVVDVDGLRLQAPGMPVLRPRPQPGQRIEVEVWSDRVEVETAAAPADDWCSSFLGQPCRLVRFPDDVVRPVDPSYAEAGDQVGFADGYPFLLISEASLDDLNRRLAQPLPMARFRPNLVVSGCAPYAEDSWRRIRIGDLAFRVCKPCSRCAIPTIDIATAERGREPLATLATYRKRDNNVYFGQNLVHDDRGWLTLGAAVEVIA